MPCSSIIVGWSLFGVGIKILEASVDVNEFNRIKLDTPEKNVYLQVLVTWIVNRHSVDQKFTKYDDYNTP